MARRKILIPIFSSCTCRLTDRFYAQANVMLAYPLSEAEELLVSKLETAQQSLANCEDDIDFLREQITVSEDSNHTVLTDS